jgi:glycosyltransferase involved in cell wall biosynthesis
MPLAPRAVVVCPVLPHPPVSGGQKRTLRLLEAMERAGLAPALLTSGRDESGAADALRGRGWAVEVLPEPSPSPAARARQHAARRPSPMLRAVEARVRGLAPSSALVQLEHTQSAYYLEAAGAVPTVLSLHNLDSALAATVARGRRTGTPTWARDRLRARAMAAVERRALPRAGHVLCVSEEDATAVRERGGRPLLAENGVDEELLELPADLPEEQRVLFFGHLGYGPNRRGLERFLAHGWPAVRAQRPTARLRVAGPGQDPALARWLAAAPGVEPLGVVPDIASALAGVRAVVVPLWEGGGTRLKVLEALASARPVVSTPLGAAGLGVRDGAEALLAADPAGLAGALVRLLGDGEQSAALGAAGRALATRFTWRRVLAEVEAFYATASNVRPRPLA